MAGFIAPIVSGIGSLVGGIFGGNAARNAGRTIGAAGTAASTAIGTAGNQAAGATTAAAGAGATQINNATGTAVGGVNTATQNGLYGVQTAGNNAQTGIYNAANTANTTAGNVLGGQLENLNPYLASGQQGTAGAAALTAQGFHAPTAAEAAATPGFQFQLQQGENALEQQFGASGGGATGGAEKALLQYGQNVASTYYQNAFNNALQGYNTNLNSNLALANQGLSASGQANTAAQNYLNLTNSNTMGAAQYAGNAGIGTAEYGAGFGLSGATAAGGMGMTGATNAANLNYQGAVTAGNQNMAGTQASGNFFLQGAEGTAAGEMGQANAWSGAATGLGNAFMYGAPSSWGGMSAYNMPSPGAMAYQPPPVPSPNFGPQMGGPLAYNPYG